LTFIMSDAFYSTVWCLAYHVFWLSSRPIVIGREHTRRKGGFIIACTHQSPYEVPLLMRHAARRLDFLTTTEAFRRPLVRWLYKSMNAFPLDRSRRDPAAVRTALDRLRRGRVVALFPEGRLRRDADSVVHSRKLHRGVVRIARLAGVPIVPCVIVNSGAYSRAISWLPLRRVKYGIAFGPPIHAREDEDTMRQLIDSFVALHAEIGTRSLRVNSEGSS
jgi:1-acyl-sn-glycerol-3-phosphate acyltransferase